MGKRKEPIISLIMQKALLNDKSAAVRSTAAMAILVIENPPRGSTRHNELIAYLLISKKKWYAVALLGNPAAAALKAAVQGSDYAIAKEARGWLSDLTR